MLPVIMGAVVGDFIDVNCNAKHIRKKHIQVLVNVTFIFHGKHG